jgi:branched-chain amino acid transport system permease protein
MDYIAQQVANGLVNGTIYVLIALGIAMIFALTGIVNFAHGELLVLAAYVTHALIPQAGPTLWLFALIAIGVALAAATVGVVTERALFHSTLDKPIRGFVVSIGLIGILHAVIILGWGYDPKTTPAPLTEVVEMGPVILTEQALLTILVTAVLVGVLFWFLGSTKAGRALHATAENREMAGLVGINTNVIIALGFAIGSLFAGLGGALFATLYPVTPILGGQFVFKATAVAIIGGLGSIPGTVVVGLGLGVAEAFTSTYISSSWSNALIFVLMAIVVLIRPTGLFKGMKGPDIHA